MDEVKWEDVQLIIRENPELGEYISDINRGWRDDVKLLRERIVELEAAQVNWRDLDKFQVEDIERLKKELYDLKQESD